MLLPYHRHAFMDYTQKRMFEAYSKVFPCAATLIMNPTCMPLHHHMLLFAFQSSLPIPSLIHTCLCTHKAFTSHLTSAWSVGNTVFNFLVREVTQFPMELGGLEQVSMSVL